MQNRSRDERCVLAENSCGEGIHMKTVAGVIRVQLLCFALVIGLLSNSALLALAQEKGEENQVQDEVPDMIPDPFEPLNRAFFEFND